MGSRGGSTWISARCDACSGWGFCRRASWRRLPRDASRPRSPSSPCLGDSSCRCSGAHRKKCSVCPEDSLLCLSDTNTAIGRQMDLAKYRRDRFARIPRISRSGGVLRVHSRSPIPRTRVYFERFSTRSENRETGWWKRQSAANRSPRKSV